VVVIPQTVRALPGGLDDVPVLNSNSPEEVKEEGILVSTLPKEGTVCPEAHLDYKFNGRFDIFAHHISNAEEFVRTLYLGVVLANPGDDPVKVDVLSAASYLSQPDSPFVELPAMVENTEGSIYAGPGDRVADDILRGLTMRSLPEYLGPTENWRGVKVPACCPDFLVVPPHATAVLASLPIPIASLTPHLNGRSLLFRLNAHGTVYAATLAWFARWGAHGGEYPPTESDWHQLLYRGTLAGPREKPASPPGAGGTFVYGRVAGVSRGSSWIAILDNPSLTPAVTPALTPVSGAEAAPASSPTFHIPDKDLLVSYPVSTVVDGTLGTGQVQSAPLIVREPNTAYAAHGNYGVEYRLTAAFINDAPEIRTVKLMLQTPLKKHGEGKSLSFFGERSPRVFFRGTVNLEYVDDEGRSQCRYVHLVQHQGEQGQPLVVLALKPKEQRKVTLRFIYPADATPPQVVTISSTAKPSSSAADSSQTQK
jgi:hypothetical protein